MSFKEGVAVFFRTLLPDNQLARSVHPNGREVEIHAQTKDYMILGEDRELLGIFPADWVAAILPLQTTGPATNASDQQARPNNPSETTQGDSQGFTGGTKRFNS